MEQAPSLERFDVVGRAPVERLGTGHFIMAVVLLVLGFFLIWPVFLLLINSFNTAKDWFVEPHAWGIAHWEAAFRHPGLLRSLYNSLVIWSLTVITGFPVGVAIAWILARTKVPFSHTLEFLFWVAYMVPSLPTTIAWITLLDPDLGIINQIIS